MICGQCARHEIGGCFLCLTDKRFFKPKENKMKPQFTEEELKDFLRAINGGTFSHLQIKNAKEAGYIRKSDLEILIEVAEEALAYYANTDRIDKITRGFRAMKAEIERLKK